ncbi:MAG: hypothetical protein ABIR68_13120 [Ilumatobacteraceae bacterium]
MERSTAMAPTKSERAHRPPSGKRAAAPPVEHVIGLQRQIGNRATADLMRRRGAPIIVQRFDTGEHAQMGSDKPIVIRGVSFTRKQLTAMGDFYKDFDEMNNADPAELRRLKADIETQTKFYKHEPGGRDVPEGKGGWDDDTGGRYLKQAKSNDTHFGPGPRSAGRDHKTVWENNHIRALATVRATVANAANSSVPIPEQAQAINAYGNHFLTDAFSAGHLISKEDVMAEAKANFDSLDNTEAWWQVYFHRNDFTDRVAAMVMSDPKAASAFSGYQLKLIMARDVTAHRLSELLYQFAGRESELFYSNIVKSIHDNLNHAIAHPGTTTPVQVENDRGMNWSLPGDTTLEQSPRTLEIINLAIAQAETNLDEAAAAPVSATGPLGFDDFSLRVPALLDAVWSYTPHPTAATQKKIDTVRTASTDTSTVVAAQHFAAVILDHLEDVIAGLHAKGVLVPKPRPNIPTMVKLM